MNRWLRSVGEQRVGRRRHIATAVGLLAALVAVPFGFDRWTATALAQDGAPLFADAPARSTSTLPTGRGVIRDRLVTVDLAQLGGPTPSAAGGEGSTAAGG